MQIVIDIDENVFTRLFDNGVDTSSEDRGAIDRAVRNGTVLPKGDLISRSDLKKALEVTQYNDIDDLTRTERLIDNAPTIIDANRGESD